MTKGSTAPAPTPAADTTRFYLKKSYIRPVATAISQMQERTDLSGKFARKLGRIRRAVTRADEEIQEQRSDLVLAHAEKYPEGHELAGQPTPVYATDQNGAPVFKKDKAGVDTDERLLIPDQYNVIDAVEYQKDMRAMFEEIIVVDCPCFKIDEELNKFTAISGKIADALMYLEEGADTTIAPDAKRLELVPDDDKKEEESPVAAAAAVTDEDRTAP